MSKRIEFLIDGEKHRAFAKHRLFASITEKGTLLFEHHDSTGESLGSHGDPLQWTVSVTKSDTGKVVEALEAENALLECQDGEWALLNLLEAKAFSSPEEFELWLENHDIPFQVFCIVK